MFKTYPNMSGCETSDKASLNVRDEVITYELCSSTVRNELGEEIREPTSDLGETAE